MVMYDIAYETVYKKKKPTLTHSCLLCYGNVFWVEFSEFFFLVVWFVFLSEIVETEN